MPAKQQPMESSRMQDNGNFFVALRLRAAAEFLHVENEKLFFKKERDEG